MKLEIANNSIVILGENINPSSLNHDFLKAANIIDDWELIEPPVSTPVVSILKYGNGFMFLSDPSKIQMQDEDPPSNLSNTQVVSIAKSYLQKLDYVRHTAIGINIIGFIENDLANEFLADRFIKPGIWITDALKNTSIKFSYSISDITLNLTIDAGTFSPFKSREQREGIVLNANYHKAISREFSLPAGRDEAHAAISNTLEHYRHFIDMMNSFFDLEE